MGVDAVMYVTTKQELTEDDVLNYAYDLSEAFGAAPFFIVRPDNEFNQEPHHCLTLVARSPEDYEYYIPDAVSIIQVHLRSRYYGNGYERGDAPTILAVAAWLESRIPGATIWYGGDYSGVDETPFNETERQKLWEYFCQVGHKFYTGVSEDDAGLTCDLCKKPLVRYGWGEGYAAYRCPSCEYTVETRDGGETWAKPK